MKAHNPSEAELAETKRRETEEEISFPLRDLAANVMRIARGAGESARIGRQCAGLVHAFEAYREQIGHWPRAELISRILDISNPSVAWSLDNDLPGDRWEELYGTDIVIKGALQVSASRLLDQRLLVGRGEDQMAKGNAMVEQAMAARRARFASAARAEPGKSTRKKTSK
jgi:hypothetical protein